MELDVERAKELIEQKLAEEEKEEKLKGDGAREPPAVERMNTPELEEEKRRGPRNWGLEAIKGQEKVRRSSVDLRREIIDVGSIQRLIELRKQRRQRRAERAATPEPAPPPEPLEIEGPVEPETFLRAAVQGKMHVIEKFLADGGSPDTCDEFHRTALHRSSLEGHVEILQKLLDSGATVDFRDRLDCTAVHWACRGGHLDAVKLLQDHGADLNVKDKLLSTPLHVATRTGHLDVVEHLIHCGVDINASDRVSAAAVQASLGSNTLIPLPLLTPPKASSPHNRAHLETYLCPVVAATARSGTGTVPLIYVQVGVLGTGRGSSSLDHNLQ
ncbi:ankyrin repeat domain-containing protein 2 isoform X1 [Oenanthe melanoleuca]|uniref:ankyrin repeat domain-containing protein 2 isoform X1 n=1 Tax=Oenanthe melanoleuca TaxID=2939378 RepID=UPI0024C1349D|nr:ankyrin repeat domain-containing protein 2 isoform X1 [Oenanthe melanoleuca]